MPRNSRQLSPSYCYHIMLRGINKSNLFEDDNDRNRFLSILGRCCAETETQLYAWCLMSNHVHLLLRAEDGPGDLIKKIGCSYVPYFNKKYDRCGHLFQDRYRSETVPMTAICRPPRGISTEIRKKRESARWRIIRGAATASISRGPNTAQRRFFLKFWAKKTGISDLCRRRTAGSFWKTAAVYPSTGPLKLRGKSFRMGCSGCSICRRENGQS